MSIIYIFHTHNAVHTTNTHTHICSYYPMWAHTGVAGDPGAYHVGKSFQRIHGNLSLRNKRQIFIEFRDGKSLLFGSFLAHRVVFGLPFCAANRPFVHEIPIISNRHIYYMHYMVSISLSAKLCCYTFTCYVCMHWYIQIENGKPDFVHFAMLYVCFSQYYKLTVFPGI